MNHHSKPNIGVLSSKAERHPPLPMSRAELETRGWAACDIILITGDAYLDHPSFGAALIGRWLEALGYRVGIIAQPDIRDVESLRTLGPPRLFWGVTAGNLDSDLAALTVMRKRRHEDAYSPDGREGLRPRGACIVYTALARQAFKGIPVVLGGIEASLRRFAYYDYWTDRVKRSLLFDTKADLIVYGMAERALAEVARRRHEGQDWHGIPGTAEIVRALDGLPTHEVLPAYEDVAAPTPEGKRAFLHMAQRIEHHADPAEGRPLTQRHGDRWLVVHPPAAPLTTEEMDRLYALPFTHRPHPCYGQARFPAFEMIRDSVTTHRGCYGGCRFCALGAHQGNAIVSRSEAGVIAELARLARDPQFHGTVSDLGGPTANMYGTFCGRGRHRCPERSCIFPAVCRHLRADSAPLLRLLRAARRVPGIKHVFVSSGIRFDLALDERQAAWLQDLIRHHVGGRLKIAPEHIADGVLALMGKPSAQAYRQFTARFRALAQAAGKPHGITEYFISGHPGCTLNDMVALAQYLRREQIQPEQVQDFYPVPLTLSAAMFYTGLDPRTLRPIHVARTDREKTLQRALLLCHKPDFQRKAREALQEAGRADLIGAGPECLVPPDRQAARSVAGKHVPRVYT